jgi:uncharacterized membrane protein YphA (DoxX/SURF4 family)
MSEKMKNFAPVLLRIGIALVFLWFGQEQLIHTSSWISFIPSWITSMTGISAATLVHFNGAFEVVFGFCLIFGYFTRVTALLLALHMLDITFTVGYNQIGIRDFGLSIAAIAVFLHGVDYWCIDTLLAKKE